jgi:hypothetical protein
MGSICEKNTRFENLAEKCLDKNALQLSILNQ